MKPTDLNLIPIFIAIYEEGNLSKAAARLSITQPAVSKALVRLRDIYDEPLFHRCTKGVEPTSFAMDIYPALLTSVQNFTSTLAASSEFDPKVSNRVFSIACVSVASFELLPQVMKQIRELAPHIALEVHPLFTEDFESDLRLQRYDLIIDIAPRARTVLKVETVLTERLVVVSSEEHPRLKDEITAEQFFEEEHVVVSQWQSRKSLLNADDIVDLDKRKIKYRASGVLEMLPVICGSEYIGLMPESMINLFNHTYHVKSLSMPFEEQTYELCTIWHPSRTNDSAHQWLRSQIKQAGKTINQ